MKATTSTVVLCPRRILHHEPPDSAGSGGKGRANRPGSRNPDLGTVSRPLTVPRSGWDGFGTRGPDCESQDQPTWGDPFEASPRPRIPVRIHGLGILWDESERRDARTFANGTSSGAGGMTVPTPWTPVAACIAVGVVSRAV